MIIICFDNDVLSANSEALDERLIPISFIYIKNKIGPRTEPCGTPALIVCQVEDLPFITTLCFLL